MASGTPLHEQLEPDVPSKGGGKQKGGEKCYKCGFDAKTALDENAKLHNAIQNYGTMFNSLNIQMVTLKNENIKLQQALRDLKPDVPSKGGRKKKRKKKTKAKKKRRLKVRKTKKRIKKK